MVTKMYMVLSLDDGILHYVFYYSKLLHKFDYWRVLPLLGEDIDDPQEAELWKENDKYYLGKV